MKYKALKKKRLKILIRAANWVGDAIMTTPVIRAIRRNYPSAHISLLAKPWVIPVFEHNPCIDEIIVYDNSGCHTRGWGTIRLAKELRQWQFDLTVLMQNAFEAALITFLAGIPQRIGYNTDGRTLLLSAPIKLDPSLKKGHLIDYYRGILKGASIVDDGRTLDLIITDRERINADILLAAHGIGDSKILRSKSNLKSKLNMSKLSMSKLNMSKLNMSKLSMSKLSMSKLHMSKLSMSKLHMSKPVIGINPGAAGGTAKRWFPQRYSELAARLTDLYGVRILLFGGPGDEILGNRINSESGGICVNLAGRTTLREAFALIEKCSLFITNDSGLMHAAAALGTPQIAIIGSTDHVATGPFSANSQIVRVPVPCSPCMMPHCPVDHICMERISVDMVMEAARKELGAIQKELDDSSINCFLMDDDLVDDSRSRNYL